MVKPKSSESPCKNRPLSNEIKQQKFTTPLKSPRRMLSPNKASATPSKTCGKTASPAKKNLILSFSPVASPKRLQGNSSRCQSSPTEISTSLTVSQSFKKSNGMSDPLDEVQKVLRQRISQKSYPPQIIGYEKEKSQLHDLIKRTAINGESNSLLLIGPRGCGKTMLISHIIDELLHKSTDKENLLLVKLNGLLQTNDKLALREITLQLQLENSVEDKVFGSFAETLQFLLQALKSGNQNSKPILFVLEEFDLFAQHKNQTLLYNLFDVAQSAQAPICVIGITCRLDVIELLEKRVKSRFSHRQIHLFNKLNLKQYRDLCKQYLSLPSDFLYPDFIEQWNQSIDNLLLEVSVKDILERQFSLTNDVRGLISLLTYPICQVSSSHPQISAADLVTSFKQQSSDTKCAILHAPVASEKASPIRPDSIQGRKNRVVGLELPVMAVPAFPYGSYGWR
ncbi:origin recognition complex subunit 4 [Bulinus truncatus]|nr:origin recognition complex subunit 4 [Bulinus truncatus]